MLPDERVVFCVSRVKAYVATRTFWGTGFRVRHKGKTFYVTNRHNISPKLRFGPNYPDAVERLEIEGRMVVGTEPTPETTFVDVTTENILQHDTADISIIPCADQTPQYAFESSDLASASYFAHSMRLMDRVHFVGFPANRVGTRIDQWWDEAWSLPIAREASLASLPRVPFTNKLISTTDVTLVSGHSFAGASGSPVFHFCREGARVVGVMSGHLINENHASEVVHGGMSYFTRSPGILALLESVSV